MRAGASLIAIALAAVSLQAQQTPAGWETEQRYTADFNGDGRRDTLLLLRQTPADGDIPRRMIFTAFATPDGGFADGERNARLIPTDASGNIEDPMADGEIVLRPAGFDLKITLLPATGSYETATMWYRFRFGGGCFRLVAYDRLETHRATLDTNDLRVSLMTGQVTRTTGNAESDAAPETTRERLRANPRRCLADIGNGWTFDPLAAR